MNIKTTDQNLEEPKTLKVTVPVSMHLRLHTLKILQGKNLSHTVEEALDAYFDEPRTSGRDCGKLSPPSGA